MQSFKILAGSIGRLVDEHRIVRFLISGGTAAAVHLSLFVVCTELLSLWYLYATSVGFVGGVTTSFLLQKYWTFRDMSSHILLKQSTSYIFLAFCNMFLNGAIMFLLVEFTGILPLLAQVVASATIALESFLVSSYIFTKLVAHRRNINDTVDGYLL